MTSPLVMQSQVVPANQKQKAEDDAKKVSVNPAAAQNSTLNLNRNTDVLQNPNTAAIGSVKNEKRSIMSSIVETTKSYLTPQKSIQFPEAIKAADHEDLQPTIMQKPSLERPSYHTQSSADKLILQSKKGGDSMSLVKGSMTEGMLMKAIFALLGKAVQLREESTKANQVFIEQKGNQQKRLMDAYIGFKDRSESRKETAEVFGWTSFGAGLLAGIFAIGGIVATIATAGAALPVALGAAAGVAGVVGGGSKIAEGVFEYQGQLDAGEAFKVKKEKELIADDTSRLLQDMETNDNDVASVWSKIAQILRNVPKFFR